MTGEGQGEGEKHGGYASSYPNPLWESESPGLLSVEFAEMEKPASSERMLRKTQTRAEAVLWQRLRSRQLNGRKWRRQQPIDNFIVDFFCAELRLVVEVDGDVHAFQEERDKARQVYLESQGLNVMRFTNDDVLTNLEGVLARLWELSG